MTTSNMTLLAVGVAVRARLAVGAVDVVDSVAVVEAEEPSGLTEAVLEPSKAVEPVLKPLEAVEPALTPLEAVEAVSMQSVVGGTAVEPSAVGEVPGINSVH